MQSDVRIWRLDRRIRYPEPLHHSARLPSNSSTKAVMVVTPALIVGSGIGAQRGECSDGRGLPVRWLSLRASGLTPPTFIMQMGTFGSIRPNSEKSSPPIEGDFWMRLS